MRDMIESLLKRTTNMSDKRELPEPPSHEENMRRMDVAGMLVFAFAIGAIFAKYFLLPD